jgi:hypothetical protein
MTGEGDRLRFPRGGTVSLANHAVLAAEILGGRRVGIRIEPATLMFYDLDTRELLRVRPNPLTMDQARRLRGSRPAGPPPRPSTEPIQVQRRASNSGVIMVCGQKVALAERHIGEHIRTVLRLGSASIDPKTPLRSLGFDAARMGTSR